MIYERFVTTSLLKVGVLRLLSLLYGYFPLSEVESSSFVYIVWLRAILISQNLDTIVFYRAAAETPKPD